MNIVKIINQDSVFYGNKGAVVEIVNAGTKNATYGIAFNGMNAIRYFAAWEFFYVN